MLNVIYTKMKHINRSQWDGHLGVAPHTQVPVPLTTFISL